jgi:endonuclease/exonuclease/phosphatase family metal-dependent hydrolase
MVNKSSLLMVVALLGAGGVVFLNNFEIQGLDQIRIVRRSSSPKQVPEDAGSMPRDPESIRIASFNIQVFGTSKVSNEPVMEILARTIRQFDVVAIQEIRSKSQDVVPQLVKLVNSSGRRYDFVIGERQGRTTSKEQYAYLFDSERIEVDRNQLYSILDPDDLLHRPPYIAWFRVRGPPPEQAFTFTLVNVHTDPDEVSDEVNVLDDVFHLVRDDGRGEDDVILLGDLNADDQHLGELGQISGMVAAISGVPTNTRQSKQYDNLVFHTTATNEFRGRSGVFDFMREYNLTQDQALQVSDHLPVWAEFSIYEGGVQPAVAGQGSPRLR